VKGNISAAKRPTVQKMVIEPLQLSKQALTISKYLKFILFWLGLTLFYIHKNHRKLNKHKASSIQKKSS